MSCAAPRLSDEHRAEAMAELRAELTGFSHDGLVLLSEDLRRHAVLRGSWAGCVISYRAGSPGSARRDRLGRARNAFTVLWDNGWLTEQDVAAAIADELAARNVSRVQEWSGSQHSGDLHEMVSATES